MNPDSCSRRSRRQHGAGDRPTRLASSWLEMRASACSSSSMRRSRRSSALAISTLPGVAIMLPIIVQKEQWKQFNCTTLGIDCAGIHDLSLEVPMAARVAAVSNASVPGPAAVRTDWQRVAALLQASRALDEIEETRLLPERKVLYQFSARGHDLAQILLGLQLTDPHDAATVYYRSRPLMLA